MLEGELLAQGDSDRGRVWIWRRGSWGGWAAEAELTYGGAGSDSFGWSLAAGGDRLAVGAPGDGPTGSVRVHTRQGAASAVELGLLP